MGSNFEDMPLGLNPVYVLFIINEHFLDDLHGVHLLGFLLSDRKHFGVATTTYDTDKLEVIQPQSAIVTDVTRLLPLDILLIGKDQSSCITAAFWLCKTSNCQTSTLILSS